MAFFVRWLKNQSEDLHLAGEIYSYRGFVLVNIKIATRNLLFVNRLNKNCMKITKHSTRWFV